MMGKIRLIAFLENELKIRKIICFMFSKGQKKTTNIHFRGIIFLTKLHGDITHCSFYSIFYSLQIRDHFISQWLT